MRILLKWDLGYIREPMASLGLPVPGRGVDGIWNGLLGHSEMHHRMIGDLYQPGTREYTREWWHWNLVRRIEFWRMALWALKNRKADVGRGRREGVPAGRAEHRGPASPRDGSRRAAGSARFCFGAQTEPAGDRRTGAGRRLRAGSDPAKGSLMNERRNRPGGPILLLASQVYGSHGGVQAYTRLLAGILSKLSGCRRRADRLRIAGGYGPGA